MTTREQLIDQAVQNVCMDSLLSYTEARDVLLYYGVAGSLRRKIRKEYQRLASNNPAASV